MSAPPVLSAPELARWLSVHPDWHLIDGSLGRDFLFTDFNAAFGFMSRVALLAEAANHHPDWSNSWNRVQVRLSTHEARGITKRDLTLADGIERIFSGAN